jgi:hypothetical protein
LLAFLLVVAVFFVYLFSARRRWADGSLEPLVLGCGAAVFGSLVSGLADHTLLTYPHAVSLLWLVLGLGTAAARISRGGFHADFTKRTS